MMKLVRLATWMMLFTLCFTGLAEGFAPLPMNGPSMAPAPKDENYLSCNEYKDDSIHVTITEGDYNYVHYTCARIRLQHPSQLQAVPANRFYQPDAVFSAMSTAAARGWQIAQASNAVIAINGDFYTNDKCHVVMRQGIQVRNNADGTFDVLIIDRKGNFHAIPNCTRQDYLEYYDAHQDNMYQAFCFGPVLVQDGKSAVMDSFYNHHMISNKKTQRVAICQLNELDYMIVVCDGDAISYTFGLDLIDFAKLCEEIGYSVQPEGFRMAYNLDGGNSASLFFKRPNEKQQLVYQKLNMPERERDLADMICFVTLVP